MHPGRIPVETLSNNGISAITDISKLSVAWFIKKMLKNWEKFNFLFLFYFFLRELFGLKI